MKFDVGDTVIYEGSFYIVAHRYTIAQGNYYRLSGLDMDLPEYMLTRYWPNGGTYSTMNKDYFDSLADADKHWPNGGNYYLSDQYETKREKYRVSPYFTGGGWRKDDPSDSYCWKCNKRLTKGEDLWNTLKLCTACQSQLYWMGGTVLLFLYLGTVWFLLVRPASYDIFGDIVTTLFAGIMIPLVLASISGTVYALYRICRFMFGWVAAVGRVIRTVVKALSEMEHAKAVQRAKDATPKTLTGAEVDALLTEKMMERKGWN